MRSLLEGHGYEVIEVEGEDLPGMHHRFAEALARAWARIRAIQASARGGDWDGARPRWPLIVLRSPKGWTGPDVVDGVQVPGTWRAHQVPLSGVRGNPAHLQLLEDWLRSYRPEELFDDDGVPTELVRRANPAGDLRMSATPHANGGRLTQDLDLPDFRDYAIDVPAPAKDRAESTRKLGELMRDIYRRNPHNFRLFCPDETNSNRLGAVFEASDRGFAERVTADDVKLSRDGRVMEVLSEHNCHGWLEGYNLTGRHGMFATYEAFAMVSASQTVQHSKWLQEADELDWRAKVAEPEHPADVDSVAERPQRLQPPGPGPDPERHHPARQRRPGLPAAGRQLPALGGRPLLPVAVLRQPGRHRQAAAAAVAVDRRGDQALRATAPASGTGRATTTAPTTPTSCWRAPVTW